MKTLIIYKRKTVELLNERFILSFPKDIIINVKGEVLTSKAWSVFADKAVRKMN